MFNYFKADSKRIIVRIPRIIALLATCIGLIIALVIASKGAQWNSVIFLGNLSLGVGMASTVICLIEIISVFAADLKTKTIQVATGIGISRWQIVLTKLAEVVLLVLVDLIVLFIITLITGGILQVFPNGDQLLELISYFLSAWIASIAFTSLTMIFIFLTQGTGISTIVYLALASSAVGTGLKALFELELFAPLRLNQYLLTSMLEKFRTQLVLGSFPPLPFIGILIYTTIGCVVTIMLFQKRELDF